MLKFFVFVTAEHVADSNCPIGIWLHSLLSACRKSMLSVSGLDGSGGLCMLSGFALLSIISTLVCSERDTEGGGDALSTPI